MIETKLNKLDPYFRITKDRDKYKTNLNLLKEIEKEDLSKVDLSKLTKKGLLSFRKHTEVGMIVLGNKDIAEFIGFIKYYPNMTTKSELSLYYQYAKRDNVFHESLYVTDSRTSSVEGTFKTYNITQPKHVKEYQFHASWDWLAPVIKKIRKTDYDEFKTQKVVLDALITLDINLTFRAVLAFLKEYNELGQEKLMF